MIGSETFKCYRCGSREVFTIDEEKMYCNYCGMIINVGEEEK